MFGLRLASRVKREKEKLFLEITSLTSTVRIQGMRENSFLREIAIYREIHLRLEEELKVCQEAKKRAKDHACRVKQYPGHECVYRGVE